MAMTTEDRSLWIEAMTERLREVLEPLGYSWAQCTALARVMNDVPETGQMDGMDVRERLMLDLLGGQSLDPATCVTLAKSYQRIDWSQLMVSSSQVETLMETNRMSLLRWRRSGEFPAAVEHAGEGFTRSVMYWLSDVLEEVARERYKEIRQGKKRFD